MFFSVFFCRSDADLAFCDQDLTDNVNVMAANVSEIFDH